jgi:hypothetical protein
VVRSNEARQLHRRAATRWAKHDDLRAGVRNATDDVYELAFHERPALDFKTETNEERRRGIEVSDGDTDVIESPDLTHQTHPSLTGRLLFERGDQDPNRLPDPGVTWVVYAGRTFRYPRGDEKGRAAAVEYGRSVGVPETGLNWPE